MKRGKTLYIVVPCYNENEVLTETCSRLTAKLDKMIKSKLISASSRIVFVNDGSKDNTWKLIKEFYSKNKFVCGINLSKNQGHQNALLAGLITVKTDCDFTISIDADLQDDIEIMDEFVKKYDDGAEIVYGVRSAREKDSFFKRVTAQKFYHFMKFMDVNIVYNHADYRLMSKQALNELENFKEVNLFLRGIVPLIGFKTDVVYYERNKRFAGKSKYPIKKMLSFALDGITSFSIKPMRMITATGLVVTVFSIAISLYYFIASFFGNTVQGWLTIVLSVWLIGGIQLFCIGIIGEYIGKIYMETKQRPRFIVQEYLKA